MNVEHQSESLPLCECVHTCRLTCQERTQYYYTRRRVIVENYDEYDALCAAATAHNTRNVDNVRNVRKPHDHQYSLGLFYD